MYQLKKGTTTTFEHFATVTIGELTYQPYFGSSIALSKVRRPHIPLDGLTI
jgi:hypothetical protein